MNCKYCGGILLDADVVCPNCNNKVIRENKEIVENFYEPNLKKKNHHGILIFIIILLLGVIVGGYYYVTRPDVVFSVLVNKLFEKTYQLSEEYKQTNVDFDFNIDIDAGSEYKDVTNLIKDLKFKSSINTDLKGKKIELGLGIDYKNKDLIDALMYFDKNIIYIDLKDLFNKLIKYELEEVEDLNIKEEDVKIILNNIFYALKDALKEGKYISKNEKDVNKYILVVNNENKDIMYNKFNDHLRNSNEFIDTISKITEKSKEEIIQMLNESKEEIENLEEEIYISICTKTLTNEFIKLEVGTEKNTYITFTKINDKTYKLETTSIGDTSAVVTIKTDNNKITFVYDINNKYIKAKSVFNISYKNNEKISINLSKESVLINELTEEDTNQMLENLMNNEGVKEIIEAVTTLLPQEEITIDDAYEY